MTPTTIRIGTHEFCFDLGKPIDISIPLKFNGTQPNAFGVEAARSEPCRAGDLIGDTRLGGSCNFEQYTFIPHCNGTHTECVGHITNARISVTDCLRDVLVPAVLISVEPKAASETDEGYAVNVDERDKIITSSDIQTALTILNNSSADAGSVYNPLAIVVRTRPNGEDKLARLYDGDPMPPFFSNEAVRFIVDQGFRHLLVDLPSIDRMFDEGRLSNHRIFWNVEPGSFETSTNSRTDATVTELVFVPDYVGDGLYLLNLQIAPFAADASPGRPVLFPLAGTP